MACDGRVARLRHCSVRRREYNKQYIRPLLHSVKGFPDKPPDNYGTRYSHVTINRIGSGDTTIKGVWLTTSVRTSVLHSLLSSLFSSLLMTAPVPLTLTLTLCALASFGFSNAKPSYAPKTDQACPCVLLRQPSLAPNNTLNPNEVQYLADRRELFPDAWKDWVGDGTQLGYDLDMLKMTADDPSGLPVIGIAMSGGGHRFVSVSIDVG